MSQVTIQAFITDTFIPLLPQNIRSAISLRASYIASATHSDFERLVSLDINSAISSIQNNVVGVYNPVNIINANITASTFAKNIGVTVISNVLGLSLSGFYREVNKTLLNSTSIIYDINVVRNITQHVTAEFFRKELALYVEVAAIGVFNRTATVNDILGSIFSGNTNISLDVIGKKFSSVLSIEARNRAANFNTQKPDNIDKKDKTSKGFVDPTGTYPKESYKGQVDTNKLSCGEVRGTVVQDKESSRITGIKLPNGNSWEQPLSPYKGQYPYNKVHQTESGHIVEFDDTPGAERIHIYHRSGTFMEIDPNGSMVSRTKGSEYKIIDCNGYISIAGKANVSVNGECNIYVGSDANIEVGGSAYINAANDIEVNASGRLQLTANESIDMRSAKIYIEADEELHINAATKSNIQGGLVNIKSDTILNMESTGSTNMKSGEEVAIESVGNANMKFGGEWAADSGGNTMINQEVATGAGSAEVATLSQAGLPPSRVDNVETIISDPQAIHMTDQYTILAETEEDDKAELKNKLITDGIATREQIETPALQTDADSGGSSTSASIVTCDSSLIGATCLPDNYQLSPHFTLGMLSSKAAVSKYKVVAQSNLTYGQIVSNLQLVALNILEPIYNVFPSALVTSGFRLDIGNPSQHNLGMAVDIQFKGMPKDQYYDTAKTIRDLIVFDQFLLEFCSYSNNPWIHISLKQDNNRKQILTFWNHARHSTGLANLA